MLTLQAIVECFSVNSSKNTFPKVPQILKKKIMKENEEDTQDLKPCDNKTDNKTPIGNGLNRSFLSRILAWRMSAEIHP